MGKVLSAVGDIVVLSVVCMLLGYLSPNGRIRKSINMVISLAYTAIVAETILELIMP